MQPIWQRLIRFEDANGEIHLGEPITTSEDQDIGLTEAKLKAKIIDLGQDLDIFSTSGTIKVTDRIVDVKKLLGPLTRSEVPVIRCIGLNYAKHSTFDHFKSLIRMYNPNIKISNIQYCLYLC